MKKKFTMGNDLNKKGVFARVVDYFLQGLLYMAPIGVTIFIIYKVFGYFDEKVQIVSQYVLNFKIPGLGVISLCVFITLIGYLGQLFISKPVKIVIEKLIAKAPVIQVIYTSIRDLMNAFVGKEKRFNKPVLVKVLENPEIERIGFLTASDLTELGIKDKVAVYFPHSYAFSGELLIFSVKCVKPLDIQPAEAMKFIVSGGVSKFAPEPEDVKKTKN